jgi:isoleucyl-tRNA synthetase
MFNYPKKEEEILKFWQDNKIFEKTLKKTEGKKPFVFYDGPPFATGLPHYGHILSSVAKDVFPRYKTMQGFYVRRRWGWDCHGLPIENIVEKELGLSGKKDIEEKIGVEKFNQICRSKVLTYIADWKKIVDRIARFVDFDNSYKTMDSTYMESVWWALKTLWDKGLIYEGKKVLMYCPHCETPVSKAEVAMDNSYKDVTEEAVIVKFKIKNCGELSLPQNTYFLAWTTTPWTLPGNVALAINKKIDYDIIFDVSGSVTPIGEDYNVRDIAKDEKYIIAKSIFEKHEQKLPVNNLKRYYFSGKIYEVIKTIKGEDLVGIEYEPLYEIPAVKNSGKKAWYVAPADFVNTEEGTGIVHTAVIYGEDDFNLGVKIDLPMIQLLDSRGSYNNEVPEFLRGKYIKSAEKDIKADLEKRGLLFARQQNTHPYPFCWRCDTQLFYNAISAWFINIQKDKKKLIKFNEKINWYPEHLKHGRFLNILETAPDWNISRNRYWATPLPFFKCECGQNVCIGSIKELKEKAVNFGEVFGTAEKLENLDLHKDKLDRIKIKCLKCQKEITRIPEVIDCWVESSSMPFAELHYPFENKKEFKDRLPAQYIAEYIAQTRTWFYYMHVLSILLFGEISFENVICTGTILSEKGEKLSKSKKNYKDPWEIINQYGVDALRFYLMSNPVMSAEDLFFNEKDVRDVYNKVVNSLCNVAEFYNMYADRGISSTNFGTPKLVLDKWILSKLNNFISQITLVMDKYDTIKSCRLIKDFAEDLSLWYVRRSRDRFKEENQEKEQAQNILRFVLLELSKIIAPILPYTAEFIYEKIGKDKEESVHLETWPKADKRLIDNELEEKMQEVRRIVSLALAERTAKGLKVRQPLALLKVKNSSEQFHRIVPLLDLIKDEVNVKEIIFDDKIENEVELDLNITEELKEEGVVREIIRAVQGERKNQKLVPEDKIFVKLSVPEYEKSIIEKNKDLLLKEFRAVEISVELSVDLKIKIKKL